MKRFLLILLTIALLTLAVFLIIQGVWYSKLDHALQLEANGFYKEDVTMLTFGQSAANVCCWLFGIFSGLGALAAAYGAYAVGD